MTKRLCLVPYLLCGAIIIWGIYDLSKNSVIRYYGSSVQAAVIQVDNACDRYNHITVVFESKEYELRISQQECRDKKYRVGQMVTVLKHRDYDELLWPTYNPIGIVLVFATLAILIYYTNRDKFRSTKKFA